MSRIFKKWMVYISYPLFCCLFFNVTLPTSAQNTWEFDQQDLQSYQQLLSLKRIDTSLIQHKNRNSTLYLLHFRQSVQLLISDNPSKLADYEKRTERVLDQLRKQKSDSPYLKFYTAEVLLQSAFVHLKLGHEFNAGWELRKAYREIRRNIKTYPDFLPHYKTIGLLHIIIGSVPDKYNWLLSLMGMEGSVKDGMNELKSLADSDNVFNTEAKLLILLMQGYILQESTVAVDGLKSLYNSNPQSLLIGYIYVSVLMKSQESEAALQVLESLKDLQYEGYIEFSLLVYLKAEALLQKGDYLQAIEGYQQFSRIHQGQNYLKDAFYKTGLAYWLINETDSTTKYYQIALSTGTTLTEVDKHANKQLESEERPNQAIMEVRLLTDGGYYKQAHDKIENIRSSDLTNKKDQIELNYRKARIYHQTDQFNAAIAFYKLTINNGEKNNWYFAPNSALQLGFIYQQEDNNYLAEKYFKKALSYKGYEYQNSIENKAKSGLSALKDRKVSE